MSDKTVKNRGGRPKKQIDREVLINLASIQCTMAEIAFVLGVSVDTIARNYRDDIELGKAQGKIKLRRAMFRNACEKDNAVMQIWLSKNLLNMTDQPASDESSMVLPWETETTEDSSVLPDK